MSAAFAYGDPGPTMSGRRGARGGGPDASGGRGGAGASGGRGRGRADASGGRGGMLERVLEAVRTGARGRSEIAARTGLDIGMVEAVLLQLERMGALEREELGSACPTGGCGACPSSDACVGTPGRGPVMLTLRRRPPGRD